jgi:hypothetical protein
MSRRVAATSIIGALAGFGIGLLVGGRRDSGPSRRPPLEAPEPGRLADSLRQSNRALQSEIDRLNAQIARLAAASNQPAGAQSAKNLAMGVPAYVAQRAILNNLRQVSAAREQFQHENKRPPGSLEDLVGPGRYIRQLRTIAGEDYFGVSMVPGQPMTVTTPDGMAVTYDPSGPSTTRIEVPPAQARAEELERKVEGSRQAAIEAYRVANGGRDPGDEHNLLPYFATPQEGADFVEFLEAMKVAKEAN